MPREQVRQVSAGLLRKGQQFRYRGGLRTIAQTPEKKTKYVYIDIGWTEAVRLPLEAQVTVYEIVPTAQEKYDEYLQFAETKLKLELLHAADRRDRALEALRLAPNPGYWEFERWTNAWHTFVIWSRFQRVMQYMDTAEDIDLQLLLERADEGDLIIALEKVVEELRRDVWRKPGRSGHAWGTAWQEAEIDIKREWVDHWSTDLYKLDHLKKLIEEEAQNG